MERITKPSDLLAFAKAMEVSYDWHEPDEQNLTAVVRGVHFDNTGAWPEATPGERSIFAEELHVLFYRTERDNQVRAAEPIAAVNLADLCAWATSGAKHISELTKVEDEIKENVRVINVLRRHRDEFEARLNQIKSLIDEWLPNEDIISHAGWRKLHQILEGK